MTPEQIKARELYNRFAKQWHVSTDEVKINCIICVEEIVDELNERQRRCCPMDGALLIKQVNFYLKVKEAIEKL